MDYSPWVSSAMGFSRQECWNGLSFPPPGDLPNPGMEPLSLRAPALAGRFFTASATWEALGESCILPILQLWRLSILGACPKMGLDMRGPLDCCLPGGLSASSAPRFVIYGCCCCFTITFILLGKQHAVTGTSETAAKCQDKYSRPSGCQWLASAFLLDTVTLTEAV